MFAGVLGGASPMPNAPRRSRQRPAKRRGGAATWAMPFPSVSWEERTSAPMLQHLRSSRNLHVSLHTSKIMKPMAKGFASHAAVLSFVADNSACRGEGEENGRM